MLYESSLLLTELARELGVPQRVPDTVPVDGQYGLLCVAYARLPAPLEKVVKFFLRRSRCGSSAAMQAAEAATA